MDQGLKSQIRKYKASREKKKNSKSLLSWTIQKCLGYNVKSTIHKIKNNKMNFLKIKNFCSPKDTINRMKRYTMNRYKIFANYKPDNKLTTRIFLKFTKLNIEEKTTKQLDKWAKDLDILPKKISGGRKAYWKDATSLVIRKRQVKTTIRYHCILIKMAKTKMVPGDGGAGEGKERKRKNEKKKITILST